MISHNAQLHPLPNPPPAGEGANESLREFHSNNMNATLVLQTWHEMLPESVCVCAGPLLEEAPPLTEPERHSVGNVDAHRARELQSGRFYAKHALSMLGVPTSNLPVGLNRAPLWPAGVIGSITHTRSGNCGHVAAAVARKADVIALGIDAEYENGLDPRLWEYVLTVNEQQRIQEISPQLRAIEAQVIWCSKEAVIKAMGQIIEPTDIEIKRDSTGNLFKVTLLAQKRKIEAENNILCGRTARVQGLILASVILMKLLRGGVL